MEQLDWTAEIEWLELNIWVEQQSFPVEVEQQGFTDGMEQLGWNSWECANVSLYDHIPEMPEM